jgi:hypothetical protein
MMGIWYHIKMIVVPAKAGTQVRLLMLNL